MRARAAALAATLLIGLALLSVASGAVAQTFTNRNVNMRAGPDRVFPMVTWLPPNTQVRVLGCTSDWRWCDVVAGRNRGWVHVSYLSNVSRRRTPIVTFSVGSYWDLYYRNRPWYSSRAAWVDWGRPSWRPPPPPPRGPW